MAHGIFCSKCEGTVDWNEYDFCHDMCKECVAQKEHEEIKMAEIDKFLKNNDFKQMELEDMLNAN